MITLAQQLGFRLSDIQEGFGVFARADGATDHHNIYFLNANLPFPGLGHVREDGRGRYSWVPIDFAPCPRPGNEASQPSSALWPWRQ